MLLPGSLADIEERYATGGDCGPNDITCTCGPNDIDCYTPELDVVFLIDSTGSMHDEIREVKTHIINIVKEVQNGWPKPDMRVGLVTYRDHKPEERAYVVKKYSLTNDIDEALEHIENYGSGHSEAIVTEDHEAAMRFLNEVDAACVYVNASTRFTDGGQFGLGAEVGISTQKLHARGPMGLKELTTYKWIILGNGQVRP